MAQIKLAEYTFDNSVGDCLPTLTPNTITMTKEDVVSGTTTKRIVYIDTSIMPTTSSFCRKTNLLTVEYLNINSNIVNLYQTFYSCTSLTYVDCSSWDTSNVTSMYETFNYCPALKTIKSLSSIDTSKVTQMYRLFRLCALSDLSDIKNWDVSKVTNFNSMFENNPSLKTVDVSGWTTTSCTNMSGMFNNCPS
ncbi:MAG: BspA family leucine-rich repeat surface protein [Turicibacter sp.]|nr:BspA family leucine-rich repeat surface protein [Turicibacter sp.]